MNIQAQIEAIQIINKKKINKKALKLINRKSIVIVLQIM